MIAYLELLARVLDQGVDKPDRTGVGTKSLFGYQMRFDLNSGFPLVTTKKIHFKSIVYELLWFLSGDTNIHYLQKNGISIWNEWADERGNLGPIYGHQWRKWQGSDGKIYDQIAQLIETIRLDPHSRRLVVSAWNAGDLPSMRLAPCHCLFQFYVADGKLSCQLYQRSADLFLGVPFNIGSYALLTYMIAHVTGLGVGEFIHTFGDVHLYNNHLLQAKEQLKREVRPLPRLILNDSVSDIFSFNYNDIGLINYNPHPLIPAPVAV